MALAHRCIARHHGGNREDILTPFEWDGAAVAHAQRGVWGFWQVRRQPGLPEAFSRGERTLHMRFVRLMMLGLAGCLPALTNTSNLKWNCRRQAWKDPERAHNS